MKIWGPRGLVRWMLAASSIILLVLALVYDWPGWVCALAGFNAAVYINNFEKGGEG